MHLTRKNGGPCTLLGLCRGIGVPKPTNLEIWHYSQLCVPIYLQFPSLYLIMLVNGKIDVSGCNRITFQGYSLRWSISFLMAQQKQSWQYWHFCIVESL